MKNGTMVAANLLFATLIAAEPARATLQSADTTGPTPEPIVAPTPPALPAVSLPNIAEFSSDETFAADVERRMADLLAPPSADQPKTARVENLLSAANLLLAERIEPLCSRRVLGLEEPADAWPAVLDRAEGLLAESQNLIAQFGEQDELGEGWLVAAQRNLETLSAFSTGLRAFLFPADGEEGTRERQLGASALSPLLEHPNPAVREAATLWQAHLRLALGDIDRASALLPAALSDAESQRQPYAFYVRLLRSRLASERGWATAAMALQVQIEQRCHKWFNEQDLRDRASRTAQYEQIRTLRTWHDRLDPRTQAEQRAWCVEQMQSLIDTNFKTPATTVLRLTRAVPILAEAPAPPPPSAETVDEPETGEDE
jgi:hypothetical protein